MKLERDAGVFAAATLGMIGKEHLAFFWAWQFYEQTGQEPTIKEVMYGVGHTYQWRIGKTTAHAGIGRVREYKIQEYRLQTQ